MIGTVGVSVVVLLNGALVAMFGEMVAVDVGTVSIGAMVDGVPP